MTLDKFEGIVEEIESIEGGCVGKSTAAFNCYSLAVEMCKGFAEWCGNNSWMHTGENNWIQKVKYKRIKGATTEELFKLYEQLK